MTKLLDGLSIAGYRSFRDEVKFENLSDINILIGQNNSGKSNLLRFLTRHFLNIHQSGVSGGDLNDSYDRPRDSRGNKITVGVQLKKKGLIAQEIDKQRAVTGIQISDYLFSRDDNLWLYYEEAGNNRFAQTNEAIQEINNSFNFNEQQWQAFYRGATGVGGGHPNLWQTQPIPNLNIPQYFPRQVSLIPSARSLRTFNHPNLTNNGEYHSLNGIKEHGGIGLIDELFRLQNPAYGHEKDKLRFNKINDFMRTVTENETLQLEIPHNKTHVVVNMDGKRLDLDSLGAGIEQVLIMAAKSTLFDNQIVCIEEPEIYLHPTLQRKLIQYLRHETNNQYFIATHSAHLLDAVPASVYHVKLVDRYSQVITSVTQNSRFEACYDLGYRASDLLQCNCIIWVEGPSDRIFLNLWLGFYAPELIENVHYSIMFYGGKLLSHLTTEEDTGLEDFIKLQSLNRNMAIVIDSDREAKGGRLRATKTRIQTEFINSKHHVWITEGREIENYIPYNQYINAVIETHGNKYALPNDGKYEKRTDLWKNKKQIKSNKRSVDKVAVARLIESSTSPPSLTELDLKSELSALTKYIKSANLHRV